MLSELDANINMAWNVGLGEFGNNFHMIIDPRFP